MASLTGKKILIVDDEPGILLTLELVLESHGAIIIKANSGNEAFELVKKENFDMVISDVRMPNGSGIELLEKIKKINPAVPSVLLATGYSEITPEEARAKGAVSLIDKPFDFDMLVDLVRKTIGC